MKSKKTRLLIITVLALLLIAGCKSNAASDAAPAPEAPSADPATPAIDPTAEPAPAAPAVISVDFATEEAVRRYDTVNFFTEPGYEAGQKIIFTTDTPVTDFKYFTVSFSENGVELIFEPSEELYSFDELTPELPIVVTWEDIGLIPARGISYVDADGTTKRFTISESGEDGSVLLVEF